MSDLNSTGAMLLKNFGSKLAVGRMAYEAGYFSQAYRHYSSALQLAEDNDLDDDLKGCALLGAAKSTAALGNFEQAKKYLNQALVIHESDEGSLVEEAEDYHQLSLIYWRSGNTEMAKQIANKAWELACNDSKTPDELKAKLLKHFAILAEQEGKVDECERYLNKAMDFIESSHQLGKQSSIYGDVLLVKVLLLIEQNRFEEAVELYPQALQIVESNRGITHPRVKEVIDIFSEIDKELRSGVPTSMALNGGQRKNKHGIV